MKHNINDLFDTLFETLKGIQNKEEPLDIERALATKDVAQVIINAAKVEIDHMRVAGGIGSGFIPVLSVDRSQPMRPGDIRKEITQGGTKTITAVPGGCITEHRMQG